MVGNFRHSDPLKRNGLDTDCPVVQDYSPQRMPEMPEPVLEADGRVRIGSEVYTPTHPLTRLGLASSDLPQIFIRSPL